MLLGLLNGMCVSIRQIKGYIKEVLRFVCWLSIVIFKAMLPEDITKILLNFSLF